MSALNWIYQESEVHLACDTLVATDAGEPMAFATKIFPIPHARTLIAGTGLAQLLGQAAFTVATSSVCRHVVDVDRGLGHELWPLWNRIAVPGTAPSSTIYVFGWDETRRRMRAYAYRSSSGFESEELSEGVGTKPPFPLGERTIEPFEDFMVELVLAQRLAEETKPAGERVGIGGEVVMAHLTEHELVIRTLHRFDDYPDMFNEATKALRT